MDRAQMKDVLRAILSPASDEYHEIREKKGEAGRIIRARDSKPHIVQEYTTGISVADVVNKETGVNAAAFVISEAALGLVVVALPDERFASSMTRVGYLDTNGNPVWMYDVLLAS